MISSEQVEQFYQEGVALVDTPLSEAQITAAAAAMDRLLPAEGRSRVSRTCDYYDEALLEIIQHPFFEEVAKQVLQTEAVLFFQTAIIKSYPQPGVEFSFDQHVDIQYCTQHMQSVPRHMVCSFFLWISDVNSRRAPLVYRPGSHWQIAAERDKDSEWCRDIPRTKGFKLDQLPQLEYAEPVKVTARAGQVGVLTTATVHGGSINVDTEPRLALVITFHGAGLEIGLPDNQLATKRIYDRKLLEVLRPERVHIVNREG